MFKNTVKTSNYEIGEYNDSMWLKVFYHNHSTKENFKNESEARHCNSEFKYSILDEINPSMRIKGKYEFVMDFPDENIYIRWQQNKNPVKELDYIETADGFRIIEDNRPSGSHGFFGLTKVTRKGSGVINSFIDGMPNSNNWYYAVGMYEHSAGSFKTNGIPAYKDYVKCLRLWIKIDPKGKYRKLSCNTFKQISTGSIILTILLLSS